MGIRSSKVPLQNTPVKAFNTEEFYTNEPLYCSEIKPSSRVPRHATHVEFEEPGKFFPENSSRDVYSVISNDLYRSLYAPEVKTVHGTEISS
jgi:hypothetical protein